MKFIGILRGNFYVLFIIVFQEVFVRGCVSFGVFV